MQTKHPDTRPLDCWLFNEDEMEISDKASCQSSAQLLAISDGGMEHAIEASRYSSAQLLAISEGLNIA